MTAAAPSPDVADATVDLDAYLVRIGYDGPRAPTLATLGALQERHIAAIPFEAIDVVIGKGVDISPAAIDAKLISGRRGGYCYEQNGLFRRVLAALGFAVEGLMARVLLGSPPGDPIPRSHMTLRVTIEGAPWLADVGFGRMVPPEPLPLDGRGERRDTRHEPYRIIRSGALLTMEASTDEGWTPLYEIGQDAQLDIDFEPANWFTSTHPSSSFRRTLVVARTTPEARISLLGPRLTVRRRGAEPERRILDLDGLERELVDSFELPFDPAWSAALRSVAA